MGPNLTPAEGFILGLGAKMFTTAGPVIICGVSGSVVYGLIYWICKMVTGGYYPPAKRHRFIEPATVDTVGAAISRPAILQTKLYCQRR